MNSDEIKSSLSKVQSSIVFNQDEVLGLLGAFIDSCENYKFILADIVTARFTEETYSITEIEDIIINEIEPVISSYTDNIMQIADNKQSQLSKLNLSVNIEEPAFFYEVIMVLRAFTFDVCIILLTKYRESSKYKKINIDDNDALITDWLKEVKKYIKDTVTAQKKIEYSLYRINSDLNDSIVKDMIDIVPLMEGFLVLRIQLVDIIAAQMRNMLSPILIPNGNIILKIFAFKIFQLRATCEERFYKEMIKIAEWLALFHNDELNKRLNDNSSTDEDNISNSHTNYEKIDFYECEEEFEVCSICEMLHDKVKKGTANYRDFEHISSCLKLQEENIKKFKKFFSMGSKDNITIFQDFVISNIIMRYCDNTDWIDDKSRFQSFVNFFSGQILQKFYSYLPNLVSSYNKDMEWIKNNNKQSCFTIENGEYGRFESDDIIDNFQLDGFREIDDAAMYLDSANIINDKVSFLENFFNEKDCYLKIYKNLYVFWICITFSEHYDINTGCLLYKPLKYTAGI